LIGLRNKKYIIKIKVLKKSRDRESREIERVRERGLERERDEGMKSV
jgi:hypothetical protein